MSIITDALKKAEHERELKTKHTSGEGVAILAEEARPTELFLDETYIGANRTEKNVPAVETKETVFSGTARFSSWPAREIFILAGAALSGLFILSLFVRWPEMVRNFSLLWLPSYKASVSETPSSSILGLHLSKAQPVNFLDNNTRLPFILSGISVSGADRYAIINGKVIQEGDSINGAYLKEILDREVILETKTGEIKLKISS